jgi:two-component system, sensor histidine kinase and response regulator
MADLLIIALVLLFITGTTLLVINYLKLRHMHDTIIRQKAEIVKQMQQQARGEARVRELMEKNNQLIRIVSHDLKSPINRIFALIQLIQEEPQNLSQNQHDYLGKTHQTIADINSMIRNFLDTRWLDDPALELRAEKINLTQSLNSLVKSFQPLASRKKIQIQPSIAQNVFIYEDKHFLLRILENLMSNAVKFSTENKNIYIGLEEDENNYTISIRDEGPGISDDDQRKLYQKYSPLSTRPTGGESTTGLGLAIVKSLTDKMGMVIKCASQVGAGTTFSLIIDKNKNQQKAIQLQSQ